MGYQEQVKELEDFIKFNVPAGTSRRDMAGAIIQEGWLKNKIKLDDLIKNGVCLVCNTDVKKVRLNTVSVVQIAMAACDIYWGEGSYTAMVNRKDSDALEHWNSIGIAISELVYSSKEAV